MIISNAMSSAQRIHVHFAYSRRPSSSSPTLPAGPRSLNGQVCCLIGPPIPTAPAQRKALLLQYPSLHSLIYSFDHRPGQAPLTCRTPS